MTLLKKIDNFFSGIEWKLSLGTLVWGLLFPTGSFLLPAWGVWAGGVLESYSPLSWIVFGFGGLLLYSISVALIGVGRQRSVRSRYDANFMRDTGGVDPMAKVFENKRINLNDLVLPSNPIIDGKTFVDCEIVGPANLYLEAANGINDHRDNAVDAVALSGERVFYNGFLVRNCQFRGCRFHRVTLFFHPSEVSEIRHLRWLNWISPLPTQPNLPMIEASPNPALSDLKDRQDADKTA